MRISDWSSDVCSSDLGQPAGIRLGVRLGYASGQLGCSDCTETGLGLDFYWRRQSKSSPSTNQIQTLSAWRSEADPKLTPRGSTADTGRSRLFMGLRNNPE